MRPPDTFENVILPLQDQPVQSRGLIIKWDGFILREFAYNFKEYLSRTCHSQDGCFRWSGCRLPGAETSLKRFKTSGEINVPVASTSTRADSLELRPYTS
jgi:hypothetical protein